MELPPVAGEASFGSIICEGFESPVIPETSGLLIDTCTFGSLSTQLGAAAVVLGLNDFGSAAHDIIIRNSTFTHRTAPALYADIQVLSATGLLVENCVFDSNGHAYTEGCQPITFNDIPVKSANIQVGFPALTPEIANLIQSTDIIVRNSIFSGKSQVGFLSTEA